MVRHHQCIPGSGSKNIMDLYVPGYDCFLFVMLFTGGMFTANTMSSAVEALGMALPGAVAKILT